MSVLNDDGIGPVATYCTAGRSRTTPSWPLRSNGDESPGSPDKGSASALA